MGGCIVAGEAAEHDNATAEALAQAQGFQGLAGADLAQEVTGVQRAWTETPWDLSAGYGRRLKQRVMWSRMTLGLSATFCEFLRVRAAV